MRVLHGRTDAECEFEMNREERPDGSVHLTGTTSDCNTYDYVILPDGSGEGRFGIGTDYEMEMTWGAPIQEPGPRIRQTMTKRLGDGTRMAYEWVGHYDRDPFVEVYSGTITLADGRTMRFSATREKGEQEQIEMQLPDGSRCEVTVALGQEGTTGFIADFAEGLSGQYTDPGGKPLFFEATGGNGRLTSWQSSSPEVTGEFVVQEGYACRGELTRGGDLVGALRWADDDGGTLELLTGRSAEVSPAGAALDFAVDRWLQNAAALGPTPLY
jgi:hypothetical protein